MFFASEKNTETFEYIEKTRKQPYFFQEHVLPENIILTHNIEEILPQTDIIISIIPCQFIASSFLEIQDFLKPWVVILNLAKGIDNTSLETISEKMSSFLNPFSYTYAYLSGGMIAQELIDGNMLGADIVTENIEIGAYLKNLFESENLAIQLKIENPKNTELSAALKNVIALILGYYEGQWAWASTLGYYFTKLLGEMQWVIEILSWDTPLPHLLLKEKEQAKRNMQNVPSSSPLGEELRWRELSEKEFKRGIGLDFTSFALSGDLIATCFGNSRNRLLGNMLGKGMDIEAALVELKAQKKIAEGYETLKGIQKIIAWKEDFEEITKFCEKYL